MEQFACNSPQIFAKNEFHLQEQSESHFMQNQNINSFFKNPKTSKFEKQYLYMSQTQKKKLFYFFTSIFLLWVFVNGVMSLYNYEYLNFGLSIMLGLLLLGIIIIVSYFLKTLLFDYNVDKPESQYPYWLYCGIFIKHFSRYIQEWYFKSMIICGVCFLSILGFNGNEINISLTHTYLLSLVVCTSFYVEQKIEKSQFIDMFNKIKVLKEQKDLLDILIPSAIFVCQVDDIEHSQQENQFMRCNTNENAKLQTDLNNTRAQSTKKADTQNNSYFQSFQNQSHFGFPSALKNFNPTSNLVRMQTKHIKIDYANKNSLNIFEVQQSSEILDKLQYMMQEEADQEKNQEVQQSLYSKIKQQLCGKNKTSYDRKKSMTVSGQIEIMNIVEDKNSYKYGQSYFNVKYVNCYWNQKPSLLVLLVNVSQEKRNQQLQQMNSYKDRLLATVSHDLKTPLNCIISLTGQIKEMNIESIAENIDIIYNNSLMLLFMIKDILDYSQIMHRKLKLSSEKINLQQCIREVFDIFQFQCSSQNIDLIQQVEDITFYNDKNRLKQIIINFVSNAIKFTKQGFVTVKAINLDDCVRISVGDTGTGMSEAVVKQLFKEYGTFDNNEKMNQQGIGLGLVICKNLVGALGPDENIKVESTVGLGSTFTFDIYKNEKKVRKKTTTQQNLANGVNNRYSQTGANPTRDKNVSVNKSRAYSNKDGEGANIGELNMESIPQEGDVDQIIHHNTGELNMSLSSANLTSKILAQKYKTINTIQNRIYKMNKKYNIIIVDDSKYNLIALKIYLNDYKNFDVEEYIHAEKALQRIKDCEKKFDIVFTDLQMPFMDGLELTKQIRQLQNRIQQPKIVIVTADSSDFQKLKSYSYGINDYIEKPITDKDLFRSKIIKLLD